jgi:hypothetical protein
MSEIIDYLKKVDQFLRSIDGIPYSFRNPIDEWISERNQWIMYAAPQCVTKSQAISSPLPNVWIGSPSADGNFLSMGLSYQTKPLVETFLMLDSIPNREVRDKFLTILSKVSANWKFTIQQKTRWDTFTSSPEYDTREAIPCSEINANKLVEILNHLRKIKSESHKRDAIFEGRRIDYQGPAFNLMEVEVVFPSPDFGVHAREIFNILQMCLKMKDPATISREIDIMKKEILFLRTKLIVVEKAIKWDRSGPKSKRKMIELAESYRLELASYPKELDEK